MKLVNNTYSFYEKYTIKEQIDILADAGYHAIDFSFFKSAKYFGTETENDDFIS